jgi:hypothetical protein
LVLPHIIVGLSTYMLPACLPGATFGLSGCHCFLRRRPALVGQGGYVAGYVLPVTVCRTDSPLFVQAVLHEIDRSAPGAVQIPLERIVAPFLKSPAGLFDHQLTTLAARIASVPNLYVPRLFWGWRTGSGQTMPTTSFFRPLASDAGLILACLKACEKRLNALLVQSVFLVLEHLAVLEHQPILMPANSGLSQSIVSARLPFSMGTMLSGSM